jgi:ribosomal protein S14
MTPWRVGGIPAPGGGPVGRSRIWIRVTKSSKAAHRGHALLRRGIAATRTAQSKRPAPWTGIGRGTGQRHPRESDCDKNDRSHDCLRGRRRSPAAARTIKQDRAVARRQSLLCDEQPVARIERSEIRGAAGSFVCPGGGHSALKTRVDALMAPPGLHAYCQTLMRRKSRGNAAYLSMRQTAPRVASRRTTPMELDERRIRRPAVACAEQPRHNLQLEESFMTKSENRCASCGGKLGLVSHHHRGLRFCRKACKENFLAKTAKDHACMRRWFGFGPRKAS